MWNEDKQIEQVARVLSKPDFVLLHTRKNVFIITLGITKNAVEEEERQGRKRRGKECFEEATRTSPVAK